MQKNKKGRAKVIQLPLSKKQEVERMYIGPYDHEWRDDNGKIDNGYLTISKRTGLPTYLVALIIENIIQRRNITKLPLYLEYDQNYPQYVIITLESKINHESEDD